MPQLNAALPIVFENGTMQAAFQNQMLTLGRLIPIVGTGSPEGVVTATQYSLYIDSAGVAGAIEYRKMLTDIGGDVTQGWLLV